MSTVHGGRHTTYMDTLLVQWHWRHGGHAPQLYLFLREGRRRHSIWREDACVPLPRHARVCCWFNLNVAATHNQAGQFCVGVLVYVMRV